MNRQHKTNRLEPVRILVFSASLSKNSINKKLASIAASIIEKNGGIVDFAHMREFDTPSYDHDLEESGYYPPGAEELKNRILANDAYLISSPDYNGSMPGILKNTIDWVSRSRPQPFNGKHALLMSASPSIAGGNPGLWSLRMPLEKLGSNVFPSMFSLANAHIAFTPDGKLKDTNLIKRLEENLTGFMNTVEANKHYTYLKKAWLDFIDVKNDPLSRWVERSN